MVEQRKLIWIALSELYLDTDLSKEDFDRLAEVLKKSGLKRDEIRAIDLFEVFPVLHPNFLSVAGEWVGFKEDWFVTECRKRLDKRNNPIYRLRCHFFNRMYNWMRKDYWHELEKRIW